MKAPAQPGHLYIFLDEGGDLGFNPRGSRYFTLSAVTAARPFPWDAPLTEHKYDLLEWGLDLQGFHAAEDNAHVRARVLGIIARHLSRMSIDSIVVEKVKTRPALRREHKFYPRMLGELVRRVVTRAGAANYTEVIAITDTVPLKGKRNAIDKAIKETLARMIPRTAMYRVLHHASASCAGLQVADYCNWAIFKKWERGDESSYRVIQGAIQSEFDIFKAGTQSYY